MHATTYFTDRDGSEFEIYVEGTFIRGQDADRDQYGLPTECATADSFEIEALEIDGVDADISEETANRFVYWCKKDKNTKKMTLDIMIDKLEEALAMAAYNGDDDFDYTLPF